MRTPAPDLGFVAERSGSYYVKWRKVAAESYFTTSRLVHEISRHRHLLKGRLLDIGCGEKPYRLMFAHSVDLHVGVDMPHSQHKQTGIDAFATSAALPFAADSFDSILCTEVLEHVENPLAALQEMARVLKPGGKALLSTPFMYRIHEQPYDFYRYTPYCYHALADKSGLKVNSIHCRGGYFSVLVDYLFKGLALGFSALNQVTRRAFRHRRHLLQYDATRMGFSLLQWPFVMLLRNERVKSDIYTLGYVVVLEKPTR